MVTESNMKHPLKGLERIHVILSSKYCKKTNLKREPLHLNNPMITLNNNLAAAYNKCMGKTNS